MIHFVVCDDISLHNQTMQSHLEKILPQLPVKADIALVTTNPYDVIHYAQNTQDQNIYLLDLVLEQDINGLHVCQTIQNANPSSYILYVSAYAEYAMECCQSHAFDFILKPYTFHRLQTAIHDVIKHLIRAKPVVPLPITTGSIMSVLDQREIYYIRSQREYVIAYTTSGSITWRESMTNLIKRLNADWFVRVHKSFIMNRLYYQSIDTYMREITLQNGDVIPLSRTAAHFFRQEHIHLILEQIQDSSQISK